MVVLQGWLPLSLNLVDDFSIFMGSSTTLLSVLFEGVISTVLACQNLSSCTQKVVIAVHGLYCISRNQQVFSTCGCQRTERWKLLYHLKAPYPEAFLSDSIV